MDTINRGIQYFVTQAAITAASASTRGGGGGGGGGGWQGGGSGDGGSVTPEPAQLALKMESCQNIVNL